MWPAILQDAGQCRRSPASSAIVVGVVLGTLIHRWRALRETLDPLFAAYYAIPVFAFYPLFIVIFGLGDVPQVLIGFMLGLVAVIVNTLNGLDRVPRVLLKTARIHRLGPVATALKVTLPYAVPYIFTGIKLAVAYSFIGVIGAELIMSRTGLGYEIGFAYNNFDNAVMYPLIVFVLAVAASVNTMFFLWEKKLLARRRTMIRAAARLDVDRRAFWRRGSCCSGTRAVVALTSPLDTIAYAAELLASPRFYPHLIETAQAFAVALGIAISCGILIGFTLGLYRFAGDVGEPVLVALYSIPKITLYPIVLLTFGIGMPAKIAFGAIHGIIPIAIFALGAVRNLNPVYLKAARVMRMPPSRIASRVLLPAAIPEIFTGIRIGFSLTLIGTLLGEMFASQRGLGHLLIQAIGLHNVRVIMALTLAARRHCRHGERIAARRRPPHPASYVRGNVSPLMPAKAGIQFLASARSPLSRDERT